MYTKLLKDTFYVLLSASLLISTVFAIDKSARLPSVRGNAHFAEKLINYHSREALLCVGATTASFLYTRENWLKIKEAFKERNWGEIERKVSNSDIVNFLSTFDVAYYLNPYVVLYLSSQPQSKWLDAYSLVVGAPKAKGLHMSIGKFPMLFGSGASESPFGESLVKNLGVAATRLGIAVHAKHYWGTYQNTKLSIFGLVPPQFSAKEGIMENVSNIVGGLHLQHYWTLVSSYLDNITVGISGVTKSAIEEKGSLNVKPVGDIYVHVNKKPFQCKIEGAGEWGNFLKNLKSFSHYAWHGEVAYNTAFKYAPTIVGGYTYCNDTRSSINRFFFTVKASASKHLQYGLSIRPTYKADKKGKSTKTGQLEWSCPVNLQFTLSY